MSNFPPDGRHRKVLRSCALQMHKLASDMKQRRGHIPDDEPKGYVDAFSRHLRERARTLEKLAKSLSCADLKSHVGQLDNDHPEGSVEHLAHERATYALYIMVNHLAQREGINPFKE